MSPPDNFMEKLMKRMDVYYSPKNVQTKQKFFKFSRYLFI